MSMRLQKFLSQAGICSRRKGEAYILEGRVAVNGETVNRLGTMVDPEQDQVKVDGRPVTAPAGKENFVYIALNKPEGYVSSCSHKGEKIILDLIGVSERIYPVGRLDKESVGLILLTNDGDLHNRLSHPSYNHEKEYVVETVQPVTDIALAQMASGVILDGKRTRKAKVKRLADNRFTIILKQGINRQIRRMVAQAGNTVKHLNRIRMGTLQLGRLKPGSWRYLNAREVQQLKGKDQADKA